VLPIKQASVACRAFLIDDHGARRLRVAIPERMNAAPRAGVADTTVPPPGHRRLPWCFWSGRRGWRGQCRSPEGFAVEMFASCGPSHHRLSREHGSAATTKKTATAGSVLPDGQLACCPEIV